MSESINPAIKVAKVLDSRLTAGRDPTYLLHQGASEITYRSFPSSNLSSSSVIYNNVNPPSAQTFVSRTVYVEVQYQVNFTGTALPGQNLLDGYGYDWSVRALPVNNSFKSLTVSINGSNFTQDQNDVLAPLTRVRYDSLKCFLSQAPTVLDNAQLYSEGVGTNRNPLASAQNAPCDAVMPRGAFEGVTVLTNTPTAGSILIRSVEPLIISPLAYTDEHSHLPAFYNVSTFQVQATFDAQLADRIISLSNASQATFTSVSATPTASNIYFGYYAGMLIQKPPAEVSYPWHQINRYIQSGNNLAPGATTTLNMNNIQLSSIPSKMYLLIKPTRSSYNIRQTDTFARINSVSVQFGVRSSLLANCDANQLYQISKTSGLDMEWSDFHGNTAGNHPRSWSGVGSVLSISPMKDLGLSDLATSGTSQTIQVQIQVSYTSLQPSATLAYDAYLYVVSDGLISIPGAGVLYQQESITARQDLLNAPFLPSSLTSKDVYEGGSFFGDIKSFFQNPPQWLKTTVDVGKKVLPYVAPLIGLGGLSGGMRRGAGDTGGGLSGGAKISKKKLLALMN